MSRENLRSQSAVELYASVMAQDGIFGERVELQVLLPPGPPLPLSTFFQILSILLAAPVHLFYFVNGHSPSLSNPSEVTRCLPTLLPDCRRHLGETSRGNLSSSCTPAERAITSCC